MIVLCQITGTLQFVQQFGQAYQKKKYQSPALLSLCDGKYRCFFFRSDRNSNAGGFFHTNPKIVSKCGTLVFSLVLTWAICWKNSRVPSNLWVGVRGFSKVVATFSHVGGSFNRCMATTRDV